MAPLSLIVKASLATFKVTRLETRDRIPIQAKFYVDLQFQNHWLVPIHVPNLLDAIDFEVGRIPNFRLPVTLTLIFDDIGCYIFG